MPIEQWALLGVALVLLFAIGTLCLAHVRIRRGRYRDRPPPPLGYSVVLEPHGRTAVLHYREGQHTVSFNAEFGSGAVIQIVTIPAPRDWDREVPWASGRRAEVLARIGQELVRQGSGGAHYEFADDRLQVLERKNASR